MDFEHSYWKYATSQWKIGNGWYIIRFSNASTKFFNYSSNLRYH